MKTSGHLVALASCWGPRDPMGGGPGPAAEQQRGPSQRTWAFLAMDGEESSSAQKHECLFSEDKILLGQLKAPDRSCS